jgi:hypothetical protein
MLEAGVSVGRRLHADGMASGSVRCKLNLLQS